MSKRKLLRLVSLLMLIAAVIFVICALCCPTCGRVVYIGGIKWGGEQWRACYASYVSIMLFLWLCSFFTQEQRPRGKHGKS